jgi:hypothetical protein
MLGQGTGAAAIAAVIGVAERTVVKWRAEAGIQTAARHRRDQPAPCGTQSAYRRHLRRGETPDDGCRGANAAADRRLRLTGSTRAKEPA